MTKQPQRVLQADVHDALELSAWINGGIGAGLVADEQGPRCLVGHVSFLCVGSCSEEGNEMLDAIDKAFDHRSFVDVNDHAVEAINRRHGAPLHARVPFGKWCKELNVVRGK